jgi:2-C-methyl-D-erythritol 4-phosphate cytidylyltransferase
MFRLGPLTQALAHAIKENTSVTDEAAAMSLMGIAPLMVEGHADNIKITRKPDVELAEFYLAQQEINP